MTEEVRNPEFDFEKGYKDNYKVTAYFDSSAGQFKWSPTNEDFFTLVEMWFEAEDMGFEGGYGSMWPLFFCALTRKEGKNEALGNNQKGRTGNNPKGHFLDMVDEYGDEIIRDFEELVEEARKEKQDWE